ncbi:MAG: DsbA family oxidoreductase [Anaerolineae bacterium]|nr:DsbA family oxidoreductase [Anaerolineae bacterium]
MIIDVFHDTACPWCRIGKQHLKLAIEQWTGEPITVRYHTFFLNDRIRPEGEPFAPYMMAKGGGQVPLEFFFDAPRRAGANVGLAFNFEAIQYAPNTLLSHRLIALTPPEREEQMIDALYQAYFQDGRNIGDLDELVRIAAENGFEADEIRALLLSDEAQDEVIAAAQMAGQLGVTGVPFFVFNNALAFSGAQPPETILRVMQQALDFQLQAK